MSVSIEVAISENISSTERGNLLEVLGQQVLNAMQYKVTQQVRLTGIEVDLIGSNEVSGDRIYVECKAKRDALSADVITKLLGNVELKQATSGWLITTGHLGKDAKGIQEEWEQKPPEKRRKLHLYTPERLVDLLVSTGRICSVQSLKRASEKRYSDDSYLLITNHGRFWAIPLIDADAGVSFAVMLFDVRTGEPITDSNVVDLVSQTDTSLKDLDWLTDVPVANVPLPTNVASEVQNIITITAGDTWADYRPARPQDFVGRIEIQAEVFDFFEAVRLGTTTTRLVALKAPSGWGKSSVLLKLIERCKNKRNRGRYFMYAVDARAATSPRYGEIALMTCLRAAVSSGFIPVSSQPMRLTGSINPFSDPTIEEILASLRREQKVIILLFDQFEEIFSKKQLAPLFENIRTLCSATDSIQENIVIGFAWKTDGTIPQDHPAYYMWHSLADRRREFALTPFSSGDISRALARFTKELDTPLNPILRRHLSDHCQGYPWLLKKLCIHVYDLVRNGTDQSMILDRGLNVKELFEKDRSELTAAEDACLLKIGQESPAEFFQIQDAYGGEIVQSLINRRLVTRRGARLTLYWDIFRDYVLTGVAPHIPVTYIPQTALRVYCEALRLLLSAGQATIADIAERLKIGEGAAENIARDLVMIGTAKRQSGMLTSIQSSEAEAVKTIRSFLTNHVLFRYWLRERGQRFTITSDEIKTSLPSLYVEAKFSESTWRQYVNRMTGWLTGIGLLTSNGSVLTHNTTNYPETLTPAIRLRGTRARKGIEFLGQSPPERVIDMILALNAGNTSIKALHTIGQRNSIYVLESLDAIDISDGVIRWEYVIEQPELWLKNKIPTSKALKIAQDYLQSHPTAKSYELGNSIAESMNFSWSNTSKTRYGNGLLRWVKWLQRVPVKQGKLGY